MRTMKVIHHNVVVQKKDAPREKCIVENVVVR